MNREQLLSALQDQVSDRVVAAMAAVPREMFVPEELAYAAYDDRPLPIGGGQTISAPHMVAIMCDILDIRPGMTVLEVGAGFGYHAAVMAHLAGPTGHIYTVERLPELAAQARANLARAGLSSQVTVVVGDGSLGLPEHAPYHRISVAASAPAIPEPLKEQLALHGRLVIPVGSYSQDLLLVTREEGQFRVERHMGVVFVPLIGEHGFSGP